MKGKLNVRKLTIEKWKPECMEPQGVDYENIGYYFDTTHRICVFVKKIQYDLEVGQVYEFTYEDENDVDGYDYLILKKDGDTYYMVEYYGRIIDEKNERLLGDVWVKCDVKEKLDIDLEEWKKFVPEQRYTLLPDMREKVKEYISELDAEITRCEEAMHKKIIEIGDLVKNDKHSNNREYYELESRVSTLTQVKNDLESRLAEIE